MRLGIDLMGAEQSPNDLFKALTELSSSLSSNDQIFAIVEQSYLENFSRVLELKNATKNIFLLSASQSVDSEDLPLRILREKKQTTLDLGLEFLKDQKIDALLSMANTAAFLAKARYLLPRLRFIERPGLMAFIPSLKEPVLMADVGANLDCSAKTLLSFVLYASKFQELIYKRFTLRVGLLNVGREAHKGTKAMQEQYEALQNFCADQEHLHFFGNCEPLDVFQGSVDLVLCNAFSGNIFLKTAEAFSSFLLEKLQMTSFPFEEIPVAQFIGFGAYLFKCHGNANASDLKKSILYIKKLLQYNFLAQLMTPA